MFERIITDRLTLEPLSEGATAAILAGDFSGIDRGQGWPHADTLDGLRMSLEHGYPGWLVTQNGLCVGDCGVHGPPDESGDVELGYGLAAPYRGRGYGSELVAAVSRWLLGQPGVRRVVARQVLEKNIASRRALARAGFKLERVKDGLVDYALTPPHGASRAAGSDAEA